MQRIQRKALLESRDCLIVALRLHVQLAEKVQRIGVARIDPATFSKASIAAAVWPSVRYAMPRLYQARALCG